MLPGVEWGFDDVTIAAFQREHPQLRVPGAGATRFADRARYLAGEQRVAWVAWRAEQMHRFYRRVQAELSKARPGATLYLAGADMFSSPASQQALRPQLPRKTRMDQLLLELGVRTEQRGRSLPALVLLRPQRLAPIASLGAHGVNLEINQSPELDRLAAAESTGRGLLSRAAGSAAGVVRRQESLQAHLHLVVVAERSSGQENRRRFAMRWRPTTLSKCSTAERCCRWGRRRPMPG